MRMLATLATLVAGAALALVVAHWAWKLFAPSPAALPATGPENPAATIVAANLFGGAAAPSSNGAAPAEAALGADTRLLGIIAEPGERGYALFRMPNGAKLVAIGAEIANGATLVSVDRDGATVRDGAGSRRVLLRGTAASPPAVAAAASARAPSAPRVATTSTCAPPAGFRGTVVRLNAELLGGVGPESVQWTSLLSPVPGGLVVRADNGFGAMLGLRVGDRLAQANGIALSAPDDVATAIVRPLVANQGVRLIGARDGATQELWLANVACAG